MMRIQLLTARWCSLGMLWKIHTLAVVTAYESVKEEEEGFYILASLQGCVDVLGKVP